VKIRNQITQLADTDVRDGREHEVVDAEDDLRNTRARGGRLGQNTLETEIFWEETGGSGLRFNKIGD
jgi:hypothetical protein